MQICSIMKKQHHEKKVNYTQFNGFRGDIICDKRSNMTRVHVNMT